MYAPNGPRRSTITLPQFSQYSSAGTFCASPDCRSGLAAKCSFVKPQLTCSTVTLRPEPTAFSMAAFNSALSFTSTVVDSSFSVVLTSIGYLSFDSTLDRTFFGSFFQGAAATGTGFSFAYALHA